MAHVTPLPKFFVQIVSPDKEYTIFGEDGNPQKQCASIKEVIKWVDEQGGDLNVGAGKCPPPKDWAS